MMSQVQAMMIIKLFFLVSTIVGALSCTSKNNNQFIKQDEGQCIKEDTFDINQTIFSICKLCTQKSFSIGEVKFFAGFVKDFSNYDHFAPNKQDLICLWENAKLDVFPNFIYVSLQKHVNSEELLLKARIRNDKGIEVPCKIVSTMSSTHATFMIKVDDNKKLSGKFYLDLKAVNTKDTTEQIITEFVI